jgi:hypothetical protein
LSFLSATTTTTTTPTGILIEYGIRHGIGMSFVCFKVTGPANGSAAVRLVGPGLDESTTVPLDGAGMGTGEITIFSFGSYTLSAQAGAASTEVPVNVGPAEIPCPGATSGRAVALDNQTGTLAAGTIVCLDRVSGGCIAPQDACPGSHLHGAIGIADGGGPFADPNQPACGHGQIVMSQSGCGSDSVPGC